VLGTRGRLQRVISVELSDPESAEHLASELTARFPATVIEHNGCWKVAVYRVGGDKRVIGDAVEAVKGWLRLCGAAAIHVDVEGKPLVLEPDG
jgi:hypothetical protein